MLATTYCTDIIFLGGKRNDLFVNLQENYEKSLPRRRYSSVSASTGSRTLN